MPPIRILHLITGLGLGGAETWLARLLSRLGHTAPSPLAQPLPPTSPSPAFSPLLSPLPPHAAGAAPDLSATAPAARFEFRVVSLLPLSGEHGALAGRIRALGVPVESLNMGRGLGGALHLGGLAGAARLVALLRQWRPQVVQTWLYHADLLGLFATRASGCGAAVSWGLRSGYMDFSRYGLGTRLTVRACAALSPWPEAVTANSRAGAQLHVSRLGYRPRRLAVLENGVDGEVFRPDAQARAELRAQCGADEGALLIGLAARLDPMKGHDVFCAALERVRQRFPQVRPVFCGLGTQPGGAELGGVEPRSSEARGSEFDALLERHGLAAAALRLGRRDDMPQVLAALDVLALPSLGEGFPNVVAEALCCGTPVASLDVGEARAIIGPGGIVPGEGPGAGSHDGRGKRMAEEALDGAPGEGASGMLLGKGPEEGPIGQDAGPGGAGGIAGVEARGLALAECLMRLLELGPAERARMGAAGREHVLARYGLDDAVERWAAHFESLAAGR